MGDAHSELEPVKAIREEPLKATMAKSRRTSEERLHLDAADAALVLVADDEPSDGENALAVDEQLELAVLRAGVVEAHALADRRARARLEGERAAADGRAVRVVAVRLRRDLAESLVGRVVGRKVGVKLAGTVGTPHETSGEATVVPPAAGARCSNLLTVAAVYVVESALMFAITTSNSDGSAMIALLRSTTLMP